MSRVARLGLFIFGALLLLAIAVFIVGDKQFLFSPTYRLNAPFDNVSGLHNGAEVRVGGVRKGTVDQIQMPRRPGERVTVVMDLESSTREVIKKDSVASIETEGLLGSKYVAVSFGSDEAEAVHDGETIRSEPPLDLSDLIKKTNDIMDTTSSAMKNVDEATADLKSITSKINRGEGTIGALINDKRIYKQVNTATADVRDTAAEAKIGATAFQENMQALKQNWFFRGFFNKRGYQDSTELTKDEVTEVPQGPYLRKFIYPAKEIFDKPDTAKLKNEKSLKQAGEFLERNKFGLAVVAAYTGAKGDKHENLVLTQARAMVVRQYLTDNFKLDDSRLKTKGWGEDERAEVGKASRVEITVYPEGSGKESSKNKQ
jgi:phospholipid/cholesterol/gamma-HCH transport system substrate-binding protein